MANTKTANTSEERKAKAKKIAEQAKANTAKTTAAEESERPAEEIIQEDFNVEDPGKSSKDRKAITESSEQEFEAATKEEDMFWRRTINLPSRRQIKKAFKAEKIVGDEYGEIMTEGKQRELEFQVLSDSAKTDRPKILVGRIRGVEPYTDSKGRIVNYEAKVSLIMNPQDPETRALMKKGAEPASLYSIYIPAPMLFVFRKPENFEGPNGLENLYKEMKSRINSIIDFVVYRVDPSDDRVIGSRLRAMQLKSARHYLSARHKDVFPGTKAYARVTYVGNAGIQAEVLGAECFIPNDELSWLHINSASDKFHVGDSIAVVVKTIETDKTVAYGRDYSFIRITASAKEATDNPLKKHGKDYCIGGDYEGIVTYRQSTAWYFVTLGGQIDCKCKAPSFNTPYLGQQCSVIIKEKKPEGLEGAFTYLGK